MSREPEISPFIWAGILTATIVILMVFKSILWLVVPALLAVVLYYILLPAVRCLTMSGFSHERAVLLTMAAFLSVAALITLIGAPSIIKRAPTWHDQIARYRTGGTTLLEKTIHTLGTKVPYLRKMNLDHEVTTRMDEYSKHFVENNLEEFFIQALHWLPSLLLIPYLTYFLLLDSSKLKRFILRAVPNAFFEKTLLLCSRIDDQIRAYFHGLLMLTLLDAIFLGSGLALLGIPSAFALGILTSILAWIPYLGSILGCLIVVLVAATDCAQNSWIAYSTILLFLAVRLLDDFVFMPLTVGRSLEVHPVIAVIMIFVGGAFAGVSGLFFVMPVLGIVLVVGDIIGQVLSDERLWARHAHSVRLRRKAANIDLGNG